MSKRSPLVLDSSVIVAILLLEPGNEIYDSTIDAANQLFVGAPTLVEAAMILTDRLGDEIGRLALLGFLLRANCQVIDFTAAHVLEAASAFERFSLNMGDCNSYATAKLARATLLYKGDDFALTDLPSLTLPA